MTVLDKTIASKKARNLKAGLAVTITLIALAGVVWLYLPLPNTPGRPGEGEKHSIFSDDFEHVYYERGAGPVIVLLPSLGRPASDFNELTSELANAGFRTIAVDLNVSRKTSTEPDGNLLQLAESVDAVISALGLQETERVVVIGHAFGNRLARAYAATHAGRVQAVILLAAGGRIPIEKDIRESLRDVFDPGITKFARSQALRKAFFAKTSLIPSYWRIGWDKSLAEIQIQATRTTLYEEWWDAGGVPLLVIQGDEDSIAPAAHTSELLEAEFGDLVSVSIASPAGHALLPEQPVFIANTIIAYLNKETTAVIPLYSYAEFTYPESSPSNSDARRVVQ
ncbi:MAG: alpha/beta hydrolase [Gammaproteobacteria bacterium]|nr:alpha/beta hydrolase [Gammaproteobacteria bacterium]